MFKNLTLAVTAFAIGSAALVSPASAQRYDGGQYRGAEYGSQYDQGFRGDYRRNEYRDERRGYNDDRRYYRDDRRSSRNRCNNTGGTVIGAIAGGLLGNSVAGRGDRTLGAILGAGAGALAGRAIDRSDDPHYCRR